MFSYTSWIKSEGALVQWSSRRTFDGTSIERSKGWWIDAWSLCCIVSVNRLSSWGKAKKTKVENERRHG